MNDHTSGVDRRDFLRAGVVAGAALGATGLSRLSLAADAKEPLFKISLAEWSFHNSLNAKKMTNLDFPRVAKEECGIDSVEYVDQFFRDKAKDTEYLIDLKKRCDDVGVTSGLIMCDTAGNIGDANDEARTKCVENHKQWVEAAKFLGCHSIRVNARSSGSREEQAKLAADGLRRLSEFAAPLKINVIVENHGGFSSDGSWLSGVIKSVGMANCGTLPDFGNFKVSATENYDRYKGIEELMPFAKGVSAKTYAFDADGNETTIDYLRAMKIVVAAGYHGRVGIEFEVDKKSMDEERAGVLATKKLLERIRDEMSKGSI